MILFLLELLIYHLRDFDVSVDPTKESILLRIRLQAFNFIFHSIVILFHLSVAFLIGFRLRQTALIVTALFKNAGQQFANQFL